MHGGKDTFSVCGQLRQHCAECAVPKTPDTFLDKRPVTSGVDKIPPQSLFLIQSVRHRLFRLFGLHRMQILPVINRFQPFISRLFARNLNGKVGKPLICRRASA